jgi:prolyl-tRNA editing enzyme YbaK/EbsC (Cys-tRNA(Pro) deacylase)
VPEAQLLPSVADTLAQYDMKYKVLECTPELADTAAFCEHYHFSLESAANTILVASRKVEPTQYAICVVLGTTRLDVNQKVCALLGVKRASFADGDTTIERTGMQIGGVTAVGITDVPCYVDSAVMQQPEVVMGGGNRSSKLLIDPHELLKLPNVAVVAGLAKPKE